MKFISTSLMALLFTSSVMANVMPMMPITNLVSLAMDGPRKGEIMEGATSFAVNATTIENAGEQCPKQDLEKYIECYDLLNLEIEKLDNDETDIAKACSFYENDQCKAIILEEINLSKECHGPEVEKLKIGIDYFRYMYYCSCPRDEQGQFCPITQSIIEFEPRSDDIIKEQTCQSPKCAEAMDKLLDFSPAALTYLSEQNTTIPYDTEYFDKKRCPKTNADAKSAATKVWSFSIVSMTLSLYAMAMVLF